MAEQVSLVQAEVSDNDLVESSKAMVLGSGIVVGYLAIGFAILLYLLWLITNIYELLIGNSFIYDSITYFSIWSGLFLAFVFIGANILALYLIIFISNKIVKAIKKE
ncbi:MAG: hypothetical protein ACTSU7_01095 [Candidatus Heimdallarchaeaceae archaeon]